jgi:DNA modification methylase
MCGDATVEEDVKKLMDGKKAALLHADPPYGMGKENDGVQNDNLYREKLDAFQMKWWRAFRPFLYNNASAYIWGNSEDLWRLWYAGGLKESERITFRNEIIWDKGYGQGMESERHRMFPTVTERCLFFMLGEQGFNNNADNYWEGWDSVVNYLREEKKKTGWDIAKFKRLAGHSETSGCHWFDKSQWNFPTREVYNSWRAESKDNAFKKDYDELKKDFYATRAYFDNTHDKMTDVFNFPRVVGEEREGHATPKPIKMMAQLIESSLPECEICIEPFGGSGTTLMAAEQTNRICYISEISEVYCDVIIKRWETYTNKKAVILCN